MNDTVLVRGLEYVARYMTRPAASDAGPYDDDPPPAAAGARTPVVLVGGMGCTAPTLDALRAGLERAGHPVTPLTTDAGLGCAGRAVDEVVQAARRAADESGGPVGLVGHSRGGLFARAAARRAPDVAGVVVTLGTPRSMLGVTPPALALAGMTTLAGTLGVPGLATTACLTGPCCRDVRRDLATPWRAAPADVALTAIRARYDVVVPPVGSGEPEGHQVVVGGGHLGLLTRIDARRAVLSALASAVGDPEAQRCADDAA